ncbi:MAG: hypothetical protein FKY71_10560 [Spiribacter salinus]|uniref:Uncharacterized protein n=1 Tax=Spiribacter salinus TaxID=1335746 RepID=A0A540VQL7_9GAMM|nr:MAG: hypothetical protein FKY71_10560 [Spiribacter salinus]
MTLKPGATVHVAGFGRAIITGPPEPVGPIYRYPVARCSELLTADVVTRQAVPDEITEADPFPDYAEGDRVRIGGAMGAIEQIDPERGALVRFRVTHAGGKVARDRRHWIPRWRLRLTATKEDHRGAKT